MKFTRQGYGELRREDGTLVSRHIVPEEAYERAAQQPAGAYVYLPAPIRIEVTGDHYSLDGGGPLGG